MYSPLLSIKSDYPYSVLNSIVQKICFFKHIVQEDLINILTRGRYSSKRFIAINMGKSKKEFSFICSYIF
jgi:hypothetical protein